MANDRLIFEVVAEGKGLKVVQKDVNAVADGVERADRARKKAGKGQNNYNKQEKAIYQSGLSSAKGFSKMNQTIGSGSSGLVGAYATLAANVFAASAAFQVLSQAARFEQLEAGLTAVGAAAGTNLGFASEKLIEMSGHAISTEEAMRSMALGVSAGFSTDQMEGLTKIAKGASLALGRDMADAMDRLTRGAAKLEPEILDELGIMVRLDDATTKFAATMGKSADELSQFERRQAFLNAILEQGDKKFGQLAETVDVNPYNRLAASFANLQKDVVSFINKGLEPLISILSKSTGALVGVIVLFASTIARQLLPTLFDMAARGRDVAIQQSEQAKATMQNLKVTDKLPKGYTAAAKAMKDGDLSAKQYNNALSSLNRSISQHEAGLAKMPRANAAEAASYKTKQAKLREVQNVRTQLIITMANQQRASAKTTASNAVEAASQQGLVAALKLTAQAYREMAVAQATANTGAGIVTKTFGRLRVAAFALGTGLKVVGSRLLGLLGPIGMIASVGFMIYDIFKDKFIQADPVEEEVDKILEAMNSIVETGKSFAATLGREGGETASASIAGYKALGGVLTTTQGYLVSFEQTLVATANSTIKPLQDMIQNAEEALASFEAVGKRNIYSGTGRNKRVTGTEEVNAAGQTRAEIEKIISDSEAKIEKAQQASQKKRLDGLRDIVDKQIAGLQSNPAFAAFAGPQIQQLEELRARIGATGDDAITTTGDVLSGMETIANPITTMNKAFDEASSKVEAFRKNMVKLEKRTETPFTGAIDAAKGLQATYHSFTEATKDPDLVLDEAGEARVEKLRKELEDQLGLLKIPAENIDDYVDQLVRVDKAFRQNIESIKRLEAQTKKIVSINKRANTPEALELLINKQEELRAAKQLAAEQELDQFYISKGLASNEARALAEAAGDTARVAEIDKARAEFNNETAGYKEKIAKFAEQELTPAEKTFKIAEATAKAERARLDASKQLLAAQKQDLANRQKIYELDIQLGKAQSRRTALQTGLELTPGEQLRAFDRFAGERIRIAEQEYTLTMARIKMERTLLNAKTALLKAELQSLLIQEEDAGKYAELKSVIESVGELPAQMASVFTAQETAAQSTLDAARKSLQMEREKLSLANLRSLVGDGGVGGVGSTSASVMKLGTSISQAMDAAMGEAQTRRLKELEQYFSKQKDSAGEFLSPEEAAKKAAEALQKELETNTFKPNFDFGNKLETFLRPMQTMFEQLAELGTEEGPLLAALGRTMGSATTGIGAMRQGQDVAGMFDPDSSNFTEKADKMGEGVQKLGQKVGQVGGIVASVSSAISSIFDLMHAKTQMQITAVDKQIAQTKKQYGNTAEGEKRIMALEAKKEKLKKKAFDQQKKMMMAQVVMQTALAMISTAATFAAMGPVGWFSMPMALGLIAALGAAQLAIIAGMSYQGGGGGGASSSAPSSVSVGSRQNSVSTRSGNATGELAYMRGERGQGTGASDFTPAFSGRYRATGGAAYMVGEQGPEVFVPKVPGRIVSNDDMREGGVPINATFNINAIDASNMQDTLMAQRGNIIGMIREAANQTGEAFLETVDTLAMGDTRDTY